MKEIYASCVPVVRAGDTVNISVSQTLGANLLQQKGDNSVHVVIDGPQLSLPGDMIAGVYPAPGSEDSPDEFLPHVALSRRTLPWERQGPTNNTSDTTPWVVLLLFKESELRPATELSQAPTTTLKKIKVQAIPDLNTRSRLLNVLKIPGATEVQTLTVANSLLRKVMPASLAEINLLCHMKTDTVAGKQVDHAIVVSNRLPHSKLPANGDKPELHTAVLVSVERAPEMMALPTTGSTTLIVLHTWTFRPTQGGDFEQVMRSIAYRPHGGVLRFGNLPTADEPGGAPPLSAGFRAITDAKGYFLEPLEHDQATNASYRSPLRPFQPPPRSKGFAISSSPDEFQAAPPDTPLDYSHAAAFELGRLIALSDPAILEDLREVRAVMKPIEPPVLATPLPPALQKQDWVVNPAWSEQPWEINAGQSLVKDQNLFLGKGAGDVTGIRDQLGIWDVGGIVADLGSIGTVVTAPVVSINIGSVNANVLEEQFADVQQAAQV